MARSFTAASNDYIASGTPAILKPVTVVTMSVWVKVTTQASWFAVGGMNDPTFGRGYLFDYDPSSNKGFQFGIGTTTWKNTNIGSLATNGVWYHLVGQYDGSFIRIFLNGSASGTPTAQTGNITYLNNPAWNLGRYVGSTSNDLDGVLADVAVWNVVLTAGEISTLGIGIRPNRIRSLSLIGYWPLDGRQSPEPDLSGNGNSGTLTGTAYANGPPVTMFTPKWPKNYDVAPIPLSQTHFRFRTDTGAADATPTWPVPEDANGYNPDSNKFRIRFKIEKVMTA